MADLSTGGTGRAEARPSGTNRRLVLAVGIAEYATALTALEALRPFLQPSSASTTYALMDLDRELNVLVLEWWRDNDDQDWSGNLRAHVIAKARTYLTDHQAELDQLLATEGR